MLISTARMKMQRRGNQMSLLIKGIDPPEAYTSAWLTVFECVGEHTFIKTHKVSAEQMQAIPPHGPLIDADEIIEVQMFDEMHEEWTLKTMSVAEYLAFAADMPPTIIEAEKGE